MYVSVPLRGKKFETLKFPRTFKNLMEVSVPLRGKKIETVMNGFIFGFLH